MSSGPLHDAALADCNTLRLAARARWLWNIDTPESLQEALEFARAQRLRTLVLGGGSNVVLREHFDGLVLHMRMQGEQRLDDGAAGFRVRVAAGVEWHGFVLAAHARGWFGLENLALIPGTVGAAPIQNIGAYGVEIAGFVHEVHAVQRHDGASVVLDNRACDFRYRDSVFKGALAEQLVITAVTFDLPRDPVPCTSYAALAAALRDGPDPGYAEVLEAVIRIRRERLPDPAQLPNAGSFFKNPILAKDAFERLLQCAPGVVHWPQPDGRVKIAAAWLVDQAGFKGRREGAVGMHAAQALVLVNHAAATAADVLALAGHVRGAVQERFDVALEIEPAVY